MKIKVEPLTDPREIRKLLDEVAYGQRNIDGSRPGADDAYGMANALMRRCFDAARHLGLSGEDRMTLLAYHALLSYQQVADNYLRQLNITPGVCVVTGGGQAPLANGKNVV